MKNFKDFQKELLQNKEVAREYEKLTPRYNVISELISARIKNGITQKELAEKMGTKQSAIARLESGNLNPTLALLERAASVMGYELKVHLQ